MKAVLAACTVCHLNQHYERTDQVFFALPSHPTCDVSVDFLDMSVKDRAGTTRRSHHLSSRFAAQRHVHAADSTGAVTTQDSPPLPTTRTHHGHVTDFSTLECSELKNCIDNQENQSLNSFRLCPVYVDDTPHHCETVTNGQSVSDGGGRVVTIFL
jgi:hypothetical protein